MVTCFTPVAGVDEDFRAGETITCTGSYSVDQDDLDRGFVTNEAFAETEFGDPLQQVFSPVDTATVDADIDGDLVLSKSVASLPVLAVNQQLTYTLTATNQSNQTLSSVSISDPLLPTLSCSVATLAPGAELICSGTYDVQQKDIDAGILINTASAQAITPQGGVLRDTAVLPTDMPAGVPDLRLSKVALPDPFGAVGSTLSYRMTVLNLSNVTTTAVCSCMRSPKPMWMLAVLITRRMSSALCQMERPQPPPPRSQQLARCRCLR